MRRITLVVAVLFVSTANAQLNLVPAVETGQFGVFGLGQVSSPEFDIEAIGTTDDIDMTQWMAGTEYGLIRGVSLFAGGGVVDVDDWETSGAWLFGVRAALEITEQWHVGVVTQAAGWEVSDSATADGVNVTGDLDVIESQIAIAAQWSSEAVSIYGGPYFYIVDGDLDGRFSGALGGSLSLDVEEDDSFGGFIGAQATVGPVVLTAEYRSAENAGVFEALLPF